MTPTFKVGYLIGSLSKGSINRRLAKALIKLAPEGLQFEEIRIDDLPLYSYDFDADYPPQGRRLKDAVAKADGILIVTPEYNRSIPAALKNALDWASRPWGTNSFKHKPTAVIGASIGAIGTAVCQQHLRSVLGFLNAPQMNDVEAYIHLKDGLITDDGDVTNEDTAKFLADYMHQFQAFIGRMQMALPKELT
jgi:chromate reductase, NAD(P)H dehydrogenase (quinone)